MVFCGETNPKCPFQHQDGQKKKTKRKKISQEVIVTAGGTRLVSQTKIAYSDFLKRPNFFFRKIVYKTFTSLVMYYVDHMTQVCNLQFF